MRYVTTPVVLQAKWHKRIKFLWHLINILTKRHWKKCYLKICIRSKMPPLRCITLCGVRKKLCLLNYEVPSTFRSIRVWEILKCEGRKVHLTIEVWQLSVHRYLGSGPHHLICTRNGVSSPSSLHSSSATQMRFPKRQYHQLPNPSISSSSTNLTCMLHFKLAGVP